VCLDFGGGGNARDEALLFTEESVVEKAMRIYLLLRMTSMKPSPDF
jgi:hypothetical protein